MKTERCQIASSFYETGDDLRIARGGGVWYQRVKRRAKMDTYILNSSLAGLLKGIPTYPSIWGEGGQGYVLVKFVSQVLS